MMLNYIFSLLLLTTIFLPVTFSQPGLKLWYQQPAKVWTEALPIGNGSLGAMVFGGTEQDRLQLNEESVWSHQGEYLDKKGGYKSIKKIRKLLFEGKYAEGQKLAKDALMADRLPSGTNAYQTLGDLNFTYSGLENVRNYRRELLLDSALVRVSFQAGPVTHTRTWFSSAVDNMLVVRLEASQSGQISFSCELSRPDSSEEIKLAGNQIIMQDHVAGGKGVRLVSMADFQLEGGTIKTTAGKVVVSGADAVTIRLVAATDYQGETPMELCRERLDRGLKKEYPQIRDEHLREYSEYYTRASLDLGQSDATYFPTDQRIIALKAGANDPELFATYFQFGRYLLISSSRPGSMPSNLQGIWNDQLIPPWNADYHININIQMNYWPAEVTNLSELHRPFLEFIAQLRDNGRITARELYGVGGFTAHHTTDAWLYTTAFGFPVYGMWPMGAAWASTHYWEHYLFSGDEKYLREFAYPVMEEAAVFLSEFLVKHPRTGKLVTGPSMSPENTFITASGDKASVCMGPSMDLQITWHVFTNLIAAAEVLGYDDKFIHKIKDQLANLTPVEIGPDGRIIEWSEAGLEEAEPGHRHISHLYGLHPSPQYNWNETPQYMEAAKKVLEDRLAGGGGHTGWSRAWIINFYARLLEGNTAYENLRELLSKSTLPNMFDTHPPFQIDGNFGGTAGIAEMLIQSHGGDIHLLPALPDAWPSGSFQGLMARGGFEVDVAWEDGKLSEVRVTSRLGNEGKLRFGDKVVNLDMAKGESRRFDGELRVVE